MTTSSDSLTLNLTGKISSITGFTQEGSLGGDVLPKSVQTHEFVANTLDTSGIHIRRVGQLNPYTSNEVDVSDQHSVSFADSTASGGDLTMSYFVSGVTTTPAAVAYSTTTQADLFLPSGDPSYGITVGFDYSTVFPIGPRARLQYKKVFNNALGMSNVPNADRASGKDNYRAIALYNQSAAAVTNAYVWIGTLSNQVVSTTTQLAGSGSGAIATTYSLSNWPDSGWAHIKSSAGTTKEIVYYTSRTDNALVIPAAGRARLGTSATAGAVTDTVDAVPGFRFAYETTVSGSIQQIADENTAPTGRTWLSPITDATGATSKIASIASEGWTGLWIHREIPAGATVSSESEIKLHVKFTDGDSNTHTGAPSGLYRIEDTTVAGYELYVGEDDDPDFTATPDATASALPITYALTPPVAGNLSYNWVCRYRNQYGKLSQNYYQRTVTIDSAGDEVVATLAPPTDIVLSDAYGGEVFVEGIYNGSADDNLANFFRIYVTTDGTAPDPTTASPDYSVAMSPYGGPVKTLSTRIGPYSYTDTIKVLTTAYKSTTTIAESVNTTATSFTVGTYEVPPISQDQILFGSNFGAPATFTTATSTTTHDAGLNVRTVFLNGSASFYSNTTLIWRVLYDGTANGTIYIPTALYLDGLAEITGTGSSDIIEVVDANTIYINFETNRLVKIDLTAGKINCERFVALAETLDSSVLPDTDLFLEGVNETLLRIFDPLHQTYVTYAEVGVASDTIEEFRTNIRFDNTLTQVAIEAL